MNDYKITFDNILSITGKPGLYYVIAKTNKGISVRSITDSTTLFIEANRKQISLLSNIQVFAQKSNIMMGDILKELIDKNYIYDTSLNDDAFQESFKQVLPQLDYNRVHCNDMRKIAKWATIIRDKNIEIGSTKE